MTERVKTNSAWKRLEPFGKKIALPLGIYSVNEFQQILRYEWIRSERERGRLSLAVFGLNHGDGTADTNGNAMPPEALVANLRQAVRATDHVGWYDGRNVAVLLPGATEDDANRFSLRIRRGMSTDAGRIPVRVYSYRNKWPGGGDAERSKDDPEAECPAGHNQAWPLGDALESVLARKIPAWKRVLDLTVSLAMLIVLAPVFIVVGLAILLSSPGPVVFTQERVGYRGRIFALYKFRTMICRNNENLHSEHAGEFIRNGDIAMRKLDESDPRIIRGGRILRKTALDELPQLFNVLKGDMSLVGPRPCIPYEAELYARWQTHRFDVLPGITGPWQVNGKNGLSFKKMICLDINYCRNMSLPLDLKLLLATIPAVADQVRASVKKRLGPS